MPIRSAYDCYCSILQSSIYSVLCILYLSTNLRLNIDTYRCICTFLIRIVTATDLHLHIYTDGCMYTIYVGAALGSGYICVPILKDRRRETVQASVLDVCVCIYINNV